MPIYFTQRMHAALAMLLAIVVLPSVVNAQDSLQRIPENALGFLVVRNLSETSSKFERLLEPIEATFPAPLTFAKLVTGLDIGLDNSGDLVIALLPSNKTKADTIPMVLLPITNYETFAASINADRSGEICRVTLLGEDILIAQLGSHALWMNVEHQATMEKIVARTATPITTLGPIASWISRQDAALVMLPTGIEQLVNLPTQTARRYGIGYGRAPSRTRLSQFMATVSRPETIHWLREHAELAALGITVDKQSNVRLGEQLILKKSSPLAGLVPSADQQQTAMLGLSGKPTVFAAGGPIPPGWSEQLATFFRQLEQENSATNGLENISSGLWDKEQRAYQLLFEDIRSCSVVMLTGEKGEPLVGNFLGIATVPDVPEYFDALPQVIATWNEMTEQSTSDMKYEVELTTEEIAGKLHCEFVIDYGSAIRDPNVPVINWMLEATLGLEGIFRFQLAQVDKTTFLFGVATQEQMSELLTATQQKTTIKPQNAAMQATLNLLKPNTPWIALVSPQGCLRWTSRFCNEYWVLLSEQEVTLPDMPDSPPVGLTAEWHDRRWECEIVCPAATWKTVGQYLEMFNRL